MRKPASRAKFEKRKGKAAKNTGAQVEQLANNNIQILQHYEHESSNFLWIRKLNKCHSDLFEEITPVLVHNKYGDK